VRRLGVLLGALALASCHRDERTMLVVEVGSNLVIPTELSKVELTVAAGMNTQKLPFSLVGEYALPLQVGLLEVDDLRGQTVTVMATGFQDATSVVSETAQLAFLDGRSLVLRLFLARECRNVQCPADETCTAGGMCRPQRRTLSDLQPFDPEGPRPRPDAAALAGVDAAMLPGADASRAGDLAAPADAPGLADATRDSALAMSNADAPIDAPATTTVPDAATIGSPDTRLAVDAAPDIPSNTGCAGADLQTDGNNCGDCGYRCMGGRACQGGRCTPAWLPISAVGAPTPRIRHAAAASNGRAMFLGGGRLDGTGSLADTFFYDPGSDSWSPGPALNQARCAPIAVAGGGNVYAFGGLSDCSNGATTGPGLEVYNPSLGTWQVVNAANEPVHRYNHSGIWLPSNELLVFGGGGNGFSHTGSAARFDPSEGTWRDVTCSLPSCTAGPWGLFTLDGNDVVVWGWSGDLTGARLDLRLNSWSTWSEPSGTPPKTFQFAEAPERWILLDSDDSGNCPGVVTVRMFDRITGLWTSDAPVGVSSLPVAAGTNHSVWTGSELINWDAMCAPMGAGWRYQPPAKLPMPASPPVPVETFNGHRYLFVTEAQARQWPDAQAFCNRYGYHLATIEDAAENTWIGNTIYARGAEGYCWWTGLNDRASRGTWVWADGSPSTFRSWTPGEPTMNNEHCGCVWRVGSMPAGSWNDAACTMASPEPFVCEAP
jgi:hypothetical protein